MSETESRLKRTALAFLEAAGAAEQAARAAGEDPLAEVETALFDLDEFEPVIGEADLVGLKDRLYREQLLPQTVLDLVALARQVAAALLDG